MLLEMLGALPPALRAQAEVWLPTDLPHSKNPLCAELESRGIDVHHVDTPIMRRAYRSPTELTRLGRRSVSLWRRLRRTRPRATYCTTSAALIAAPISRLALVPEVLGHVQEIWTGADRRLLSVLARSCHRLVATSNAVACSLPARARGRTYVVPNATADPGPQDSIGLRGGPLRFVVASRWNKRKGYGTLLAAWDEAGAPGHLDVLGGPPPSGDATDVRALVARLDRPDSVTIVGEVADPAPYLSAADVAIIPSDEPEAFGLVAIESFARGRPVIASSAGGVVDVVSHRTDGWRFAPRDITALADIMRSLTRPLVVAAGREARRTFEQRYTSERFAHQWRIATGFGSADSEDQPIGSQSDA